MSKAVPQNYTFAATGHCGSLQAYTTQQYTAQRLKELDSIPGHDADLGVHQFKPIPIPGPRRGERSELGVSAPHATSPKPAVPERTDSPELIFQIELDGEEEKGK
ncbi:hypothetical protein DL766_000864 [Monosporascus sp. MC13-8B]|uniref:Uncharacterized protein n=1 Tax=Monosporascus cannonballus TaxID=155416 RepID=A0ABY0GRL0_9PEZI|nr:hypothetical protein DL762_010193 [Monosporascus cannonballus]RYO94100.1 hypothetical protein DL763_004168 [Monosporascus cannonballus]RYP38654.1 hypothetical protein DL766_000864 [Monosporascus sp. MC13-8B]